MIQLSIIVTVYNREKYIERCLKSLVSQDLRTDEYEIIVVNDGSTDASEEIIMEMVQKHSNIRLVNQENKGVAEARNTGLDCAVGTYITYVDSDDFVEENIYSELLSMACENNYDIIMYDMYKTYENHKVYIEVNEKLKEGIITGNDYVLTSPSPCNKIMRKKLFTDGEIRFPAGIYYEDYATIPLLANEAKSIYYLKRPLLNYFQENNSITRTEGFQKKWWDMYTASVNLNKLDKAFDEEKEYLIYLYLLVRTGIWYLQVDHFEEINRIADYMKIQFPNWRNNKYVKNRNRKERLTAYLLFKKKGNYIRIFQKLKKVRNYGKKN